MPDDPAHHEHDATERAVRASLDRTVHRSFEWTNLVLAVLFLVFIPLDAVSLPSPADRIVPFVDAALALALFALFLAFRAKWVAPQDGHAAGLVTVLLATGNGLFLVLLTHDPLQTLSFVLVALGAAFLYISWGWFLAALALANAAFLVGASVEGWTPLWIQYSLAMMTGSGLALVGHHVRYTTYTRMERLRLQGEAQKAELARALEAAKAGEEATRLAVDRLLENERLRTENRLRTEFINAISHELNTPLTPLVLEAEILRNHPATGQDPALRRTAEVLDRNIDRLRRLVQEMITAAKAQTGLAELRLAPAELTAILERARARWKDRFATAHIDFRVETDGPVRVWVDAERVDHVLDALLENALRVTPAQGSVVMRSGTAGASAVVRVTDTGAGVGPEDLGRLAEPFARLGTDGSLGRVGLGLYLSRLLVELHGGRLRIHSEGKGRGAEVSFELPLGPGGPRPAGAASR